MKFDNRAAREGRLERLFEIDRRRVAAGWSIDELAGAAGIAVRTYYVGKAGTCAPRASTIRKLERALRTLAREVLA